MSAVSPLLGTQWGMYRRLMRNRHAEVEVLRRQAELHKMPERRRSVYILCPKADGSTKKEAEGK